MNIKVVFLKRLSLNSSIFGAFYPCFVNKCSYPKPCPFISFVICFIYCLCVHIVHLCTTIGTDSTKDNLVNLLISVLNKPVI